jgi:xanthine permease
VNLAKQENLLIIACSVGMGLGVTVEPELFSKLPESIQILTANGIVSGSLMAIVLNLLFNARTKKITVPKFQKSQRDTVNSQQTI